MGCSLRLTGGFALVCCLLAGAPVVHAGEESRQIRMSLGEQKKMTIKGITKVTVGNPQVADIKTIGPNSFILFATGAGKTTLMVMRANGTSIQFNISVSKVDLQALMRDVRAALGDREGLGVKIVGEKVVIDGTALSADDYKKVGEIIALYPQVKSLVTSTPNAKKALADQLTSTLQEAGLKGLEAVIGGSRLFVEGTVDSQEELTKVESVLSSYGEEVKNLVTIGGKRMVLVEIDFVEVKKAGTDHIGIKWPFDLTGNLAGSISYEKPLAPSGDAQSFFKGVLNFQSEFSLGLLLQSGYARVLAQPRLVCASGQKAEFLAGGEVPIVTITANTAQVEYKKYGVVLEVAPKADRRGNIQMEVMTEVSDLDRSAGVVAGGVDIPGFVVDRSKTSVAVRNGETIVLANLFHAVQQKDVSKVPLLGHIPILGELFKSRAFNNKQSELCVFVTPSIVNPEAPKVTKMITDMKNLYKEAEDDVTFGFFD